MSVNLNKRIKNCSGCAKSLTEVDIDHYSAVKGGRFIRNQSDKNAVRVAICVGCQLKGLWQCSRCEKVHLHGSLGHCETNIGNFKVGDFVYYYPQNCDTVPSKVLKVNPNTLIIYANFVEGNRIVGVSKARCELQVQGDSNA